MVITGDVKIEKPSVALTSYKEILETSKAAYHHSSM